MPLRSVAYYPLATFFGKSVAIRNLSILFMRGVMVMARRRDSNTTRK
jgi:hypothetical protein